MSASRIISLGHVGVVVEHHGDWQCRPDNGSDRIEQGTLDVVEVVGGRRTVEEHDDAVDRSCREQPAADLGVEEVDRLPRQPAARLCRAADDRHRLDGDARPGDPST